MEDLVGKTLEEAEIECEKSNVIFRITSIDGSYFMVTRDYCPERLNFDIKDGIVIKANFG